MKKHVRGGLGPTLVGFGIMIFAATAPIQVVVGNKVESPPEWMSAVSAVASAIATIAALAAVYFSARQADAGYEQARQEALSRAAATFLPALSQLKVTTKNLDQAVAEMMMIRERRDEIGNTREVDAYARLVLDRYESAAQQLKELEPLVQALPESGSRLTPAFLLLLATLVLAELLATDLLDEALIPSERLAVAYSRAFEDKELLKHTAMVRERIADELQQLKDALGREIGRADD